MILPLAICMLFVSYSQAAVLGGLCDDADTCLTASTYCHRQSACTKGVCVCNGGLTSSVGACIAEKLLGDSCTSYCTVGVCTSGVCACPSGQTPGDDRRSCKLKALGQTCSSSLECQGYYIYAPGTTCSTTCECATGYKAYNSHFCIFYSDGETCTSGTTQCTPINGLCENSKCTCQTIGGTKYEWFTYSLRGYTVGGCVHPSSTKNLGYGQTCTQADYSSTGKFCADNYLCTTCPEDAGTTRYKCLSGVGQVRASYLAIVAVFLLSIKKFFY